MAKDGYYSQEEAMKRLALGKKELAGLVSEGKMREFRIEGQVKYKVNDIDALAAEINPMVGSGMDESFADGGSESAIELLPVDADGGTDAISLEETGEHLAPTPSKEDTVITPAGVSVFDEDELAGMDADPMAKTQIAPSVTDELSIEGGGGGSGLLDMTRESDDTSLGAELLDEIYSGDETQPDKAPPEVAAHGGGGGFEQIEEPAVQVPRMVVQVEDPFSGLFTGLLAVAAVLLGFAGLVGAGLIAGTLPGFVGWLASMWFVWPIIAVVLTAIGLGVGYILGKQTTA